VVVSDAVATAEEADHASWLRNVAWYFIRVATADEIIVGRQKAAAY